MAEKWCAAGRTGPADAENAETYPIAFSHTDNFDGAQLSWPVRAVPARKLQIGDTLPDGRRVSCVDRVSGRGGHSIRVALLTLAGKYEIRAWSLGTEIFIIDSGEGWR